MYEKANSQGESIKNLAKTIKTQNKIDELNEPENYRYMCVVDIEWDEVL